MMKYYKKHEINIVIRNKLHVLQAMTNHVYIHSNCMHLLIAYLLIGTHTYNEHVPTVPDDIDGFNTEKQVVYRSQLC